MADKSVRPTPYEMGQIVRGRTPQGGQECPPHTFEVNQTVRGRTPHSGQECPPHKKPA